MSRWGRAVYASPEYRRERRAVLELDHGGTTCWVRGCGRVATEVDHRPALAEHVHEHGSGCCRSLPSCAFHNRSHGGRLGNRRRRTALARRRPSEPGLRRPVGRPPLPRCAVCGVKLHEGERFLVAGEDYCLEHARARRAPVRWRRVKPVIVVARPARGEW